MATVPSGSSGTSSPKLITAEGKAKEWGLRIKFGGSALILLCVGGFLSILIRPELAKDVWLFLGPVISSALTAMLTARDKES